MMKSVNCKCVFTLDPLQAHFCLHICAFMGFFFGTETVNLLKRVNISWSSAESRVCVHAVP